METDPGAGRAQPKLPGATDTGTLFKCGTPPVEKLKNLRQFSMVLNSVGRSNVVAVIIINKKRRPYILIAKYLGWEIT